MQRKKDGSPGVKRKTTQLFWWSEKIRMGTAQKYNFFFFTHKPLNNILRASCNDCYQVSRFSVPIVGALDSEELDHGGGGEMRLRVKTNVCGPMWVTADWETSLPVHLPAAASCQITPPTPLPTSLPPSPSTPPTPGLCLGCPGLKNVRKSSWVIWPPL